MSSQERVFIKKVVGIASASTIHNSVLEKLIEKQDYFKSSNIFTDIQNFVQL